MTKEEICENCGTPESYHPFTTAEGWICEKFKAKEEICENCGHEELWHEHNTHRCKKFKPKDSREIIEKTKQILRDYKPQPPKTKETNANSNSQGNLNRPKNHSPGKSASPSENKEDKELSEKSGGSL